ncbi:MAG: LemA family protein [Candidatus Micrarchaeota archaeon]|nr:LemA family protein [Candidatus Micrarchaeota archaeon]
MSQINLKPILLGIGFLVVLFFLWIGLTYNDLVQKEAEVAAAWAQVENQYQRRVDLIPNLVNTVKRYMKHEESLLTQITALRSQWAEAKTPSEKIETAQQLDSAVSRLLVVMENYPTLKANEGVNKLMDELAGTENRIAVERERYNQAVTRYNVAIKSFPTVVIASAFGHTSPKPLFKAQAGAEKAPRVFED